ncbi:MAG: STAS domain-containing protein [Egibacteraceae bacterium]
MVPLEVRSEHLGDVSIVTFLGEFDLVGIDVAERQLRLVEQRGPAVLLLDLSMLEFLDSSAVRVVLQADDRARRDGRRLAVLLGSGLAHRLFALLGLLDRLELVSDRATVLPR